MAKKKPRRLWLNVKFRFKGRQPPDWKIKETLLRSIEKAEDEDLDEGERYALPKDWDVLLEWRNKEHKEMRSGPWAEELEASAESSPGFNRAVSMYLERWDVALVRKKTKRIAHRPGQHKRKIRPHGKRGAKAKSHRRGRPRRKRRMALPFDD